MSKNKESIVDVFKKWDIKFCPECKKLGFEVPLKISSTINQIEDENEECLSCSNCLRDYIFIDHTDKFKGASGYIG